MAIQCASGTHTRIVMLLGSVGEPYDLTFCQIVPLVSVRSTILTEWMACVSLMQLQMKETNQV